MRVALVLLAVAPARPASASTLSRPAGAGRTGEFKAKLAPPAGCPLP